jgi:hypothetical protein
MTRAALGLAATLVAGVSIGLNAQAPQPQPFPRPGQPRAQQPTAPPGTKVLPPQTQPAPATPAASAGDPDEQTLGVPIYPGAQFIVSYDASRGQRYYLFGTNTDFAQVVAYYRTTLKQRGELVYEQPPIHMFEVGRFREETMAFPPGVTVKDYTWGGSEGYINPKAGGQPARFRTIVQIVPVPAGAGTGR